MKHLFIIFVLSLLGFALKGYAEDPPQEALSKQVIIKKAPMSLGGRPHAPSNQFIVMSYDAEQGICTFELPEDVSFITVEFTETETDWTVTETAPATDPVIHVTLMPATYTVTCTTDNGSVYRGEFSTTNF